MDPITSAIIAVLSKPASTAAMDLYNGLKTLLQKKYGKDSVLLGSIRNLEQRPESKNKQEGVAEDVVDCGADKDPEIQVAASQLLDLIKGVQPQSDNKAINTGSGAIAQGKGAIAVGAGGIAVGGNVQGGINMPGSKDEG